MIRITPRDSIGLRAKTEEAESAAKGENILYTKYFPPPNVCIRDKPVKGRKTQVIRPSTIECCAESMASYFLSTRRTRGGNSITLSKNEDQKRGEDNSSPNKSSHFISRSDESAT